MEVRYRDLVDDAPGILLRLQTFLGLPPVDTTATANQSPLAQRMVRTESHHQGLAAGVNRSKVGVFRKALSDRDVELFEWVAGEQLERYGYAREYPSPRPPSATERFTAWFHDHPRRMAVKYFREPKYVAMVLSRKLHALRLRGRRVAAPSP